MTVALNAPIRSRRRPRLRLIAPTEARQRHAAVVQVLGLPRLAEVFTFAEWAGLPARERPDNVYVIAGIGILSIAAFESDNERADVYDIQCQATERYRDGG